MKPGWERTYTYVTARRLRVHAHVYAGVGIALAHREPGADNIIIKRQYRADIDSTERVAATPSAAYRRGELKE